jgi:hypothetical protein
MPIYGDGYYDKFVELAQLQGSGLGVSWHSDGALKSLGALLRSDSSVDQVVKAIAALAKAKRTKYKAAIAFLENTFPIPPNRRVSQVGAGVEAIRYLQNPVRPTLDFTAPNVLKSLKMTRSTAQIPLGMSVLDFMRDNSASTRLLLIHLGTSQVDMDYRWDDKSALEHMNDVLRKAAEHQIHVCILRDPHKGVRGQNVPTAANAVCDGLRDAVGKIPGTHVWVADGGENHSAFHDPAYENWVTTGGVKNVVVMGFDADVCVRGNVFGIAETVLNAHPPSAVPALINFVNVVTARPLLAVGKTGAVQAFDSWGNLAYLKPN